MAKTVVIFIGRVVVSFIVLQKTAQLDVASRSLWNATINSVFVPHSIQDSSKASAVSVYDTLILFLSFCSGHVSHVCFKIKIFDLQLLIWHHLHL